MTLLVKAVGVLALFCLALAACEGPKGPQGPAAQDLLTDRGQSCRVTRVLDGDTFDCAPYGRIRLLMVDAPEWNQGTLGPRATAALSSMIPVGMRVELETDVEPVGPYGRLLAYVYLPDGRMVNEELLRRGMALLAVYPPNTRYLTRFREVAGQAQDRRSGFWAEDGFDCTPYGFRSNLC